MPYLLILCFLFTNCLPGMTQIPADHSSVDSNFYIYLALGQSNMAGRGEISGKYARLQHDRVVMMDQENQWVPARHPVHFDKPKVIGTGPALSFGIKMAQKYRNHKIGLVPCAVGGTSIQHWKPGAYDDRTDTHPWDDAKVRIREAMRHGVIKGVIWHQGESDSAPEKAAHYLEDLRDLIQRLRDLTGNPDLPFVAGELGQYREVYGHINRVLEKLPAAVPYTAVASSRGLKPMADGTHFNSKSSHRLGKRMARQMWLLDQSRP